MGQWACVLGSQWDPPLKKKCNYSARVHKAVRIYLSQETTRSAIKCLTDKFYALGGVHDKLKGREVKRVHKQNFENRAS